MINLSLRKVGQTVQVIETVAETGEERPFRYSELCFNNDEWYKGFFKLNNEIVGASQDFSITLGVEYAKFYSLGMKVSQQLDGVMRRRDEERYYDIANLLQQRIQHGLEQAALRIRNQDLLSLVTGDAMPELPMQDRVPLDNWIRTITEKPAVDQKDLERYGGGFDRILSYFYDRFYNYYPISEKASKVPPKARLEFIRLATYSKKHRSFGFTSYFTDDVIQDVLIEQAQDLQPPQVRQFFTALRMEVDRALRFMPPEGSTPIQIRQYMQENRAEITKIGCQIHDYYRAIVDTQLPNLQDPHKPLYFELLIRAQEEEVESWFRYEIPYSLTRLLEIQPENEVKAIADTTFERLRRKEDPTKVLASIEGLRNAPA